MTPDEYGEERHIGTPTPPSMTPSIPPSYDRLVVSVYWADNGFIIFQDGRWDVLENPEPWTLMLELADILGVAGEKRDARRLSIGWAPGYKHHDYHPRPCSECECACDPDQSDAPQTTANLTTSGEQRSPDDTDE